MGIRYQTAMNMMSWPTVYVAVWFLTCVMSICCIGPPGAVNEDSGGPFISINGMHVFLKRNGACTSSLPSSFQDPADVPGPCRFRIKGNASTNAPFRNHILGMRSLLLCLSTAGRKTRARSVSRFHQAVRFSMLLYNGCLGEGILQKPMHPQSPYQVSRFRTTDSDGRAGKRRFTESLAQNVLIGDAFGRRCVSLINDLPGFHASGPSPCLYGETTRTGMRKFSQIGFLVI